MTDSNKNLEYALKYARMGWYVIPCHYITTEGDCSCGFRRDAESKHTYGKHPMAHLVPHGQNQATTDEALIREWWTKEPNANIAINLFKSGLVAVDIDPRNGGWEGIDSIETRHGLLRSDVEQFSGGGGEHRVFALASDMSVSLPGQLADGVDLKRNGYIMVEPSNHYSGKRYEWEASSDPLDGVMPSPLPDWIRDLAHHRGDSSLPSDVVYQPLSERDKSDLTSALQCISSDPYDVWIRVGMGLHATGAGQEAFDLWDQWSQKSDKYDPVITFRKWVSFRNKGLSGVTKATIFQMAQDAGWENPAKKKPEPIDKIKVASLPPQIQTPTGLLSPPGIVGVVAGWIESNARRPQPQFSVQAALAFAATVLGRRYVTDQRNWPSLYMLNIGKSASGKEHAKWAIEKALDACDLGHLIGPASYTSDSGLLSTLARQPSHIAIIDEFGKVLEDASVKNGSRSASTMRALMEAWGRCDGTMRPQGYSTFGMTERDIEKLAERTVRNPAVTLLAMTTPETLFDTIGMAAVRDGFLNRFLIVETDIGRQKSRSIVPTPLPEEIIAWSRYVREHQGLTDPDTNASMEPVPKVVPISYEASYLFDKFEDECLEFMNSHDKDGLAEMFGRTREMAMRVSLIIAVGSRSEAVEAPHAAWAINYTRYYSQRAVERLKGSIGDSEFDALKRQVYDIIIRAGDRGCTIRDLVKASRKFARIDKREQANALESLAYIGDVALVTQELPNGRKRTSWVAVDNRD